VVVEYVQCYVEAFGCSNPGPEVIFKVLGRIYSRRNDTKLYFCTEESLESFAGKVVEAIDDLYIKLEYVKEYLCRGRCMGSEVPRGGGDMLVSNIIDVYREVSSVKSSMEWGGCLNNSFLRKVKSRLNKIWMLVVDLVPYCKNGSGFKSFCDHVAREVWGASMLVEYALHKTGLEPSEESSLVVSADNRFK
jgi:hypothetical protein